MNRLLYILLLAVVFFSCKEKKADNDWGKMNLRGKVKMIKETDYFLDTTGADKGKKLRWTKFYMFNLSGNLVHTFQVSEKGDTGLQVVYEYDTLGRIRAESSFSNDVDSNDIKAVKSYYYDSLGNNIAVTIVTGITNNSPDGYVMTKFSNWFNKEKQLTRQTRLLGPVVDGRYHDSIIVTYIYNKQGSLIADRTLHANGDTAIGYYDYDDNKKCTLERKTPIKGNDVMKIVRAFDKDGNMLEETSYEEFKNLHSQKKMEYLKPDKQGNWTEQRIHWHDLGTTVLERVIEYYP